MSHKSGKTGKLNAKQSAFAREYLKDRNATQAAIRAGYSKRSARAIGCELLTQPDIRALVAEKEQSAAEKVGITVEGVLRDFEEIKSRALSKDDLGVAHKCSESIAKHLGMYIERKSIEVKHSLADLIAEADGDDE
jgi:phage terminase small subunit